jgi:hypothetical protein
MQCNCPLHQRLRRCAFSQACPTVRTTKSAGFHKPYFSALGLPRRERRAFPAKWSSARGAKSPTGTPSCEGSTVQYTTTLAGALFCPQLIFAAFPRVWREGGCARGARGRGRDSGYPLPPARTRAGATNAHGSCLGSMVAWRQDADAHAPPRLARSPSASRTSCAA